MSVPAIHNGLYTIRNRETGEHRTFRIKTQPDDAKFAAGKRVIGLLVGPENTSHYKGFGFVDDAGIRVWSARKSESKDYDFYALLVWLLATGRGTERTAKYDLMLSKRCLRCNRALTTPESLESGIGPICSGGR